MTELYNRLEKLKNKHFKENIFSLSKTCNNMFVYKENIHDNVGNNFDIEYTLTIPYECIIIYKIENQDDFNHLQNNSAPDIILISEYNNKYKLDILEIKSSMTDSDLKNISNKLIGGYLRSISLLAPLHLDIKCIDLYVAFYSDKSITVNTTSLKDKILAMHNIPCWKKNEIYLPETIDNNFFNKNNIHINKLIYNDYHNNNNSATITFPKK